MNFLDPAFIKAIAEGGAPYALIVLVVWVIIQGNKREETLRDELAAQKKLDLEQSVKREETMRSSFAAREERFLNVIQEVSDKMTQALAGTTQALTKLEENIDKNLDEMRRVIMK